MGKITLPEQMWDDEHLYPLFVYGTLRPGQALWDFYLSQEADHHEPGLLQGATLYSVDTHWSFPVLVLGGDRTIRGDVVWMPGGPGLRQAASMELRAGYDLSVVEVNVPEARKIMAWAFTWSWSEHGPLVHSNDWAKSPGSVEYRHRRPGLKSTT